MYYGINRIGKKSPKIPIEAVFTDHDVKPGFYRRERGYNFNHPNRWVDEPSKNKMIGIRRLELIPNPHIFDIGFRFYEEPIPTDLVFDDNWNLIQTHFIETHVHPNMIIGPTFVDANDFPDDGNVYKNEVQEEIYKMLSTNAYMYIIKFEDGRIYYKKSNRKVETAFVEIPPIKFAVLEENNMLEILQLIVKTLQDFIKFDIVYKYDPASGYLDLKLGGGIQGVKWEVTNHEGLISYKTFFDNFRQVNELLKLLNQELSPRNYSELLQPTIIKIFERDVWNRQRAYFHTSFSDANYGYIGLHGDFYQTPTKLFGFKETGVEFNVQFTTNGREYFLPRHLGFIIELVYVYNVDTVEISH
jgi:hypothetical protein